MNVAEAMKNKVHFVPLLNLNKDKAQGKQWFQYISVPLWFIEEAQSDLYFVLDFGICEILNDLEL